MPGKPPRTPPDTWSSRLADSLGMPEFLLWRRLRTDLELSIRQVAAQVGVSKTLVTKWEEGQSYPGPDHHPLLLDVLEAGRDRAEAQLR
jgi:predicted transcriptional regulator